MPACNLHFGLLCLRNGLVLIPENWTASVDEKEGSEVDTSHPDETASHSTSIPAAPSPPVKGQEIQKLRNFILTGISYVSLILGDYVQSLEHAQSLLSQPQLCGSLSFLGHMYAAEAMIHLGRIPEAISHLSPDHISNFSNHGSNDHVPGSTISQFPQNMTEGKTMFLVNLAVAHCLREEFDKAKKCLYQATSMIPLKDLPNEAIALAIYIELQLGNPRGALQIIKRHQLLLPGKVNDKQRRLRKSFI
ncbi:CCR4-NOT transcription complex subunit 10-B-like [Dendronephthya gigantea]|uniref:CCR4-NOT transcription complex subunit 10-B-like n=1 Tax=Dendronephthya gigantea TaxID=151771 RepID=UPI00106BAB7B|nr:CCR4-NOT transcription complex subunit 10-B-like [Dendronephthya gigantea]